MRTTEEGKLLLERVFEFELSTKEMVKTQALQELNDDMNMSKYSSIKKRI